MKNFVSGFSDLVILELITPGFLSFALLRKRFAFVAFKQMGTITDLSSPQFLYHKFLVSLIRFQEQAVAYQARGVA